MKLKCTKVLAKELNKNSKYNITCIKISEYNYKMHVDIDIYSHDNDYNYNDNTYNAIMVEYPSRYYACNRYISTNELHKIYKNMRGARTLDNFIREFNEYVTI